MTMGTSTNPTSAGRYRSGIAQRPHVRECVVTGIRVLRMVKQRDGRRVSAAGEAK